MLHLPEIETKRTFATAGSQQVSRQLKQQELLFHLLLVLLLLIQEVLHNVLFVKQNPECR